MKSPYWSSRRLALAAVLIAGMGFHGPCAPAGTFPGTKWTTATPEQVGLDRDLLQKARRFAKTRGTSTGGSGCVIKDGKLVWSWGNMAQTYDVKSVTKAFGSTALGLGIADGRVRLNASAQTYLPSLGTPPASNATTHGDRLSSITLRQLAGHMAGFPKHGGFHELLFIPGTKWSYSDGGHNWLADVMTVAHEDDLRDMMNKRIFDKIGIKSGQLSWRNNHSRPMTIADPQTPGTEYPRREFAAGINASADALARFGYLWLKEGKWNSQRLLPRSYVRKAVAPVAAPKTLAVDQTESDADQYGDAPAHSGMGWWNNANGVMSRVPTDTYWAWGLHESLVIVMPSANMVVVRTGNLGEDWDPSGTIDYIDVIEPFITRMARAAAVDLSASAPLADVSAAAMLDAHLYATGYEASTQSMPEPGTLAVLLGACGWRTLRRAPANRLRP
ncbi:MAG: serine hydrolase [Phycisphaeraceae bacterium]|nr:serine hydrolase [Phycisphaeraceae bacterium]